MRLTTALCGLAVIAPLAAAQPRHSGISAYSMETFYMTDRAVPAYPDPQAVGSPVRRVEAGRRIVPSGVSDVLVVLRAPGRLVLKRNVTVTDAQQSGSDRECPLLIRAGTPVEVLSYGGEG